MTGAMFENAPRIALRAALTGEVIGFAFEAHVAPHLANGTLASVLDDWCPSFPGFRLSVAASRISVNIAPLATLLHAATAPGLFCDVAAPPFSPQASDSSTGSALLHSPATSPDPCSTPGASTKPNDIADAVGRRTRVVCPVRLVAVP